MGTYKIKQHILGRKLTQRDRHSGKEEMIQNTDDILSVSARVRFL